MQQPVCSCHGLLSAEDAVVSDSQISVDEEAAALLVTPSAEAISGSLLRRLGVVAVLSASIGLVALYTPSHSRPQLSRLGIASKQEVLAPVDPNSPEAYAEPSGEVYMNMPVTPGQLFCWALMLPSSYEPVLLALQFAERQSLFGCDQAAVYSNKTMQIGPNFISLAVNVNLQCPFGGEFGTALNKNIFDAIWRQVVADGTYLSYAWIAKVDADCVFFPNRLRTLLPTYPQGERGTYLNNCPRRGLHGPLEVLSQKAIEIYTSYEAQCDSHFTQLCSGDCRWGEDMFMDQCLSKVLMVQRVNEDRLLIEDHCDPPPGWRSCQSSTQVAFHPFKTVDEYQVCLETSAKMAGAPIHPAYSQAAREAAALEETRLR